MKNINAAEKNYDSPPVSPEIRAARLASLEAAAASREVQVEAGAVELTAAERRALVAQFPPDRVDVPCLLSGNLLPRPAKGIERTRLLRCLERLVSDEATYARMLRRDEDLLGAAEADDRSKRLHALYLRLVDANW